mmetsp:Transcript_61317/g.138797  ORF Transcript_61317/g.138797 Transcript_61317/m.138797 type:complete len:448 (-) Transcript_61317:162-1505(-)
MHRIQPPPEQENPQTSRSTDQLHIARNQVRRRSRRRISEFSAAERLYRPWVASAQLYSGVGKCWLLLLCYGEALRRLDLCLRRYRGAFGRSKASFLGPASEGPSEGEKGPYSCPLPISSPLCCADALFCATSGVLPPASDWGNPLSALRKKSGDGSSSPPTSSSSSVSLACGIDADSSAYILGPIDPMDSSRNESLAGCCRSRYSTPFEEPGQKEPPQLPSGAKGGAPGGVERGPELGIRRCCNPEVDLRTYPSSSTPCEFSARCKVASKPGLGCCAHAAASNATGSTPLTASLAWRPLGIGGVNALASCVLTLRGAVAYSREVFSTWLISNPSRLVLGTWMARSDPARLSAFWPPPGDLAARAGDASELLEHRARHRAGDGLRGVGLVRLHPLLVGSGRGLLQELPPARARGVGRGAREGRGLLAGHGAPRRDSHLAPSPRGYRAH